MITTPSPKRSLTKVDEHNNDLGQRVHLTMQRLGYTELNTVKCSSYEGHIRLRGTLKSFYLKQVAQSIAMKTPGVRKVINEIDVAE
jgi:osmotically-inducible protein OsmY